MAGLQATFDHVHIFTEDSEASAKWFQDILGGEIVRSPARLEVKLADLRIFFEEVSDETAAQAPSSPHKGLDHFAFAVSDIDALAASLKEKGAVFTKEPVTIRPGVRICFVQGPNKVRIELLERNPKYV